jgi:hypothetical protein
MSYSIPKYQGTFLTKIYGPKVWGDFILGTIHQKRPAVLGPYGPPPVVEDKRFRAETWTKELLRHQTLNVVFTSV